MEEYKEHAAFETTIYILRQGFVHDSFFHFLFARGSLALEPSFVWILQMRSSGKLSQEQSSAFRVLKFVS